MTTLPIQAVLSDITEALLQSDNLVLEAPPGAGKTTQVPLSLIGQPWLKNQLIIMLEPRRMAARAAAERMAQLLNEPVGETVGYRIRQESKTSRQTKIIVVTEGVLTRWLQSDPSLENIGIIIFDEFHERNLDSDLGLALSLQSRELFRDNTDPLKILVMSATLDGEKVANYLDQAPLIRSEGKQFPVTIEFGSASEPHARIAQLVCQTIHKAVSRHSGNLLVFLPGQREIKQVEEQLRQELDRDILCCPLYGSLALKEQRQAIAPLPSDSPYQRKIVLATDIAETSLTIEGVSVVIDSGLVRVPEYDPNTGMTRLHTKRISKASSVQRAGRAGRLGPGVCYRLWSESQQQAMAEQIAPEILQADLTPLALQLLQWGVSDPSELKWLNLPPQGVYTQALSLLQQLGAVSQESGIPVLTSHGEAMGRLPTHPRLAHMLLKSVEIGCIEQACNIAAFLAERDPFTQHGADLASRMAIIEEDQACPHAMRGWLQRTQKQAKSFLSLFPTRSTLDCASQPHHALLLAYAYPDRIARKQKESIYKLSNGRSAFLPSGDHLNKHEWLVVAESGGIAGQTSDRIFSAIALDPTLIFNELSFLLRENSAVSWDEKSGRVVAEKQTLIGRLTVKKQALTNVSEEAIQQALIQHVKNKGLNQLNFSEECIQLQGRIDLIRQTLGDNTWPNLSNEHLHGNLEEWLQPYLVGVKTLEDLKKLDVYTVLKSLLPWDNQKTLDELAPERITVPSGSCVAIDYRQSPPVLAVKLQEMFGCEQTPSLIHGKVKIAIHLLSPARRPLQITQDLANFWRTSYQEVKKEMKGRYPKHPWPDDPMKAEATRYTKKHGK